MRDAIGLALLEPGGTLTPHSFQRADLRSSDVAVRITHCGVCFSDLSAIRPATAQQLPLVPGHEFTGVVSAVGPAVTKFAADDLIAVGNIVDSCSECVNCGRGAGGRRDRVRQEGHQVGGGHEHQRQKPSPWECCQKLSCHCHVIADQVTSVTVLGLL
jgi:D-arabinose 1-dehydrogenase-like Zn-dependent alcohol dehydrogenase